MFLVPVTLWRELSLYFYWRVIRCSLKDVITVPTREKIPMGNKEIDHFAEFWCGKELGRSRYRIFGRFNEAYNVERRQDILKCWNGACQVYSGVQGIISSEKKWTDVSLLDACLSLLPQFLGYSGQRKCMVLSFLIGNLCNYYLCCFPAFFLLGSRVMFFLLTSHLLP